MWASMEMQVQDLQASPLGSPLCISHGKGFNSSKIMNKLLKREHLEGVEERAVPNAASEKECPPRKAVTSWPAHPACFAFGTSGSGSSAWARQDCLVVDPRGSGIRLLGCYEDLFFS